MPPRGRGGKFSKPTRGGGKHFSRDLQPLDKDGNQMGMWRDPNDPMNESGDSSSEEEEEESSEESSNEVGSSSVNQPGGKQELTREQRKEQARKKKAAAIAKKGQKVAEVGDMPTESSSEESDAESDSEMPANPNHSSKARAQALQPVPAAATAEPGTDASTPSSRKEKNNLSRREREAIEKEAARERYQKLHAEGKTDEARADLARLKIIKQQREEAAARKKAEQEERAEEAKKRQSEIEEREAKLRAAAMGDAAGATKTKKKGKK